MYRYVLCAALTLGSVNAADVQADPLPEPPIEAAARRYRVQIYNTYRLDRDEFERRRAAWERVKSQWQAAGGSRADEGALLHWLDAATHQSRPDVRGSLPAIPAFGTLSRHRSVDEPVIRATPGRTAERIAPADARQPPVKEVVPPLMAHASPVELHPPTRDSNAQTVGDIRVPARVALAKPIVSRAAEDLPAADDEAGVAGGPAASRLNVGELLARASGYGVALRSVDSVLLDREQLGIDELATLLGELETLLDLRRDLLLYEQLVSRENHERLTRSLAFPQTTVAELGSRIASARERLMARTDLEAGERERQVQSLDELSKRLSRLGRNDAVGDGGR